MSHPEMSELLSAYVNDEVSPSQREYVEEHLVTCETCRDELAEFRSVRETLVSLREFPVVQGSRESTMTAIRTEQMGGRQKDRLLKPVIAAGVVMTAVTALVIALLITSGIGGNDAGGTSIARAHDVFADLESYHMSGTTVASFDGQSTSTEFDWSFFSDGNGHGMISGPTGEVEFVLHDGVQYSRVLSGAGAFYVADDGLLNPVPTRDGTLAFFDRLTGVKDEGTEKVNGVVSRRYSGVLDLDRFFDEQLAQLGVPQDSAEYQRMQETFEIQKESEITVRLWVSESDDRLQRLVIDARLVSAMSSNGEISPGPETTYRTTAAYSGFNEQAQIEAPLTPAGELQPGWKAPGQAGAGMVEETQGPTPE